MTDSPRPGIQALPAEVVDLIVAACRDPQRLNRTELRRLGSLCRSLRYSILPHVYENLAFLVRDSRWPLFTTFTRFIESYPSCARHIKRLTAETPREEANVIPPSPLLPTSFASLEHLELSNLYLVPAIVGIPRDATPFPNLRGIHFTAPPSYARQKPPRIELSVDTIQAVWSSPKLDFVRFLHVDFLPGKPSPQLDLQPVGSVSLSECKAADGALQQLTAVRPVKKLESRRTTIDSSKTPIPRVYEIVLGGAASLRGSPPLGLFPDLKRLPLTDEQFHEIHADAHPIPPSLTELQVTVDAVVRRRSSFLKVLYETLNHKTPALTRLDLIFECEVPRDEDFENDDDDDDEGDGERNLIKLNQGDWETGYLRYGYYTSYSLEMCEPGTGPNGATSFNEGREDDYSRFQGYEALKSFCQSKGITLTCSWIVRSE